MPGFNSPRLEIGKVLFDGKNKIYEIVNTTKKGQKVDESLVVKESPFCGSSMNEILFLSQLKHKNIIRYRGYEKQRKGVSGASCEEKVILFLERAHGGDVYEQLRTFGKFSEDVARSLFSQMVEAVRFIHSHNIAHRDLKLENFLLMEKTGEQAEQLMKSHLKLADFEFACEKTNTQSRRQDRAGTDLYFSPEQIQGDYCPFKSDIWALGVALYLVVCGKFPQFSLPVNVCSTNSKLRELELPQGLSNELQILLRNILESDEQSRPSIEELKRHNWTTGHVSKDREGSQTCHISPRAEQAKKCVERISWPHFHFPVRVR